MTTSGQQSPQHAWIRRKASAVGTARHSASSRDRAGWCRTEADAGRSRRPSRAPAPSMATSLDQSDERSPLLLVFLRHFGCALCREMVADVARHRAAIAARGTRGGLRAHASRIDGRRRTSPITGSATCCGSPIPEQRLYAAFALARVRPSHWLSWTVIRRYIDAIFRGGHRPGYVGGDVLQMPGAFLVDAARSSGRSVRDKRQRPLRRRRLRAAQNSLTRADLRG